VANHEQFSCEKHFYGSVTVGERGQVVIPAEARHELGYYPGDKLLVMRHPVYAGIMMCRIDAVRSFLDLMAKGIESVERKGASELTKEED
jgi:AbrB family looped-hinge helix DNA binding protein